MSGRYDWTCEEITMTKMINLSELNGEELVDAKVVSLLLGLSRRTVQDLAARGEIPRYKIGRANRFKVSDIIEYREARKVR